jgi:holo-[acyl-carrier protein] synthase
MGGYVLGQGIDLVENARVASAFQEFGERFLARVFRPGESAYALSHSNPVPYLAARWAAKEAVAKAFGTGIGEELGFGDMEVVHAESGRPGLRLHGKGLELLRKVGGTEVMVSLSHTEHYACALAMVVRGAGG